MVNRPSFLPSPIKDVVFTRYAFVLDSNSIALYALHSKSFKITRCSHHEFFFKLRLFFILFFTLFTHKSFASDKIHTLIQTYIEKSKESDQKIYHLAYQALRKQLGKEIPKNVDSYLVAGAI